MSREEKFPDESCSPETQEAESKLEPEFEKPDQSARRFRPLPREKLFVRGLIEVQFAKNAKSGVETWDFEHEKARQEFAEGWRPELKETLAKYNLLSWKPSFPLRYPWSPEQSHEAAREAYFKAGRDKFVTFSFPLNADVRAIAKELRQLPELKQVVPIPEIAAPSGPLTEPFTGTGDQVVNPCESCLTNQWYLFRCDVPGAWGQQATGNGVVIADIDWGFNINHPDLQFRTDIARNRNMFPNSPNPSIVSHGNMRYHGNAVLGLAGAAINDTGIAGIAFDATLWAIQAGKDNLTDYNLWVAALNYVHTSDSTARKVIILEVQTAGCSNIEMIPSINMEIKLAIAANVVVCVPAGNGNLSGDAGLGDDGKPIDETCSIVVGATRFDPVINQRADSNGGDRVVIYAPGDTSHDLTCGVQANGYLENFGGTSGATAKVAGVVALMLEKNYQLTPRQIRTILKHSSKCVVDSSMNRVGVLLDANQAVTEAITPPPPVPEHTPCN